MLLDFDVLHDTLDGMTAEGLDQLAFGVIRMDLGGMVTAYNRTESQQSGIPAVRVIGRDFFVEVAPCTNNAMIAERYRRNTDLDAEIDYVFTLRMRPTPVRLRLLKRTASGSQYMLVTRT